jgi:hypothetical protein
MLTHRVNTIGRCFDTLNHVWRTLDLPAAFALLPYGTADDIWSRSTMRMPAQRAGQ